MIHYLKIKNFKAIKDEVEMNFEAVEGIEENAYEAAMPDGRKLLKLVYIYGANASGKTTVLDAFDFVKTLVMEPLENKSDELAYEPFLFCEAPYKSQSSFELAFYAGGMRYIYRVNFNKEFIFDENILFYKTAKPTALFTRTTDLEKRLTKITFGSGVKVGSREKDLLEINTLHNNTVLGGFEKTNVDIPELEKLSKWFKGFFLNSITSNTDDLISKSVVRISAEPEINKWLNKFMNKADNQISAVNIPNFQEQVASSMEKLLDQLREIQSISIDDLKNTVYPTRKTPSFNETLKIDVIHKVGRGQNYTLPLTKESKGTQRYFGLGVPLYDLIHGNHLLGIDELETSLHADLLKHFLQMFLMNAAQSQLLFTTHNLSILEDQDFVRRDALWFSEKQEDGSVSLYSAADFDSTTLRKDASLINAYKAGRLGAKPNLGSPLISEQ